jgi:hypothetical protein
MLKNGPEKCREFGRYLGRNATLVLGVVCLEVIASLAPSQLGRHQAKQDNGEEQ